MTLESTAPAAAESNDALHRDTQDTTTPPHPIELKRKVSDPEEGSPSKKANTKVSTNVEEELRSKEESLRKDKKQPMSPPRPRGRAQRRNSFVVHNKNSLLRGLLAAVVETNLHCDELGGLVGKQEASSSHRIFRRTSSETGINSSA